MELKSFLGTGWGFPPKFSKQGHTVQMVSSEKDIEQSIFIILSTIQGQRVMRPKFGCNIHRMVFDPIDSATESQMKRAIERAIFEYESRITIDAIHIDDNDYLEGVIRISIDYVIITINERRNIVYPFYLIEGTDIEEI
ncbi:MAG: GPW/gp25 family protein [Chitinophagales bacterium]